jgi:hypothetical protein
MQSIEAYSTPLSAQELYQLNSSGKEHGVDEVRKLVDKHLKGYMESRDVSVQRAIADFRAGFNGDLVFPLTLKVVEEHLDAIGKKTQ